MSNKLQELTDKICELLDGTDLQVQITRNSGLYSADIREAHVLMALSKTKKGYYYGIDVFGSFLSDNDGYYTYAEHGEWHLGKTLSNQSKETIEFLHQIIVR